MSKKLTDTQLGNKKIVDKLYKEVRQQYKDENFEGLNEKINLLSIMQRYSGVNGKEDEINDKLLAEFGNSGNGFDMALTESPKKQMAEVTRQFNEFNKNLNSNQAELFADMSEQARQPEFQRGFSNVMEQFSKHAYEVMQQQGISK